MHLDHDACYRALSTRDARFDGRWFVGVRTTGVYCRPICPARTPRRENVRFYPTAAAAQEAGFRSCLRCRPELAPALAPWRGPPPAVTRGLALIADGALDGDGAVDTLADRLGVGARQLRRLFRQHLGASPIAVAQTRRVLFAQQLIAQTRMPLVEVALAAGFGSVRRFNAIFQALYGRPPRALRRAQRGDEPASSASGIELALPYAPPYDWPSMLSFFAARAVPGVEVVADGRYRRTVSLDGTHGTIEVAPATGGRDQLRATIRFPQVTALPAIVGRLRRIFDLACDPLAIAAHLGEDPTLAPLVAARPGLRVPGAWDGFELGVRAILGQQVTVVAATRLAGRLVAAFGDALPDRAIDADGSGLALTHVFPDARRLAEVPADTIAAVLGMPRARACALVAMAQAAADTPALFAPGQPLDDVLTRLRGLPGIGEWTAQYIAMRALREPDAFPAADIGLLRALADPATGRRPKPAELLARAERWRPWRAYAVLHLWLQETRAAERADPSRLSTHATHDSSIADAA